MADEVGQVTVVGAGTMGHGIGLDLARAGYDVVLCDVDPGQLGRAAARIESGLAEMAAWGLMMAGEAEAALARIRATTSLQEAAARADLAVEAVPEKLELKQRVLSELDALCPAHSILTSNTSSYMPSLLATATDRPERVLGLHFFYPPPLVPLVEVVPGERTTEGVVEAVCEVVRAAGKRPIVVRKEAVGFVANRLQVALLREALYLVAEGIATAQDVDAAVKYSFGRRLAVAGPLEMAEVQDGWDVIQEITSQILPALDHSPAPSPLLAEMVAQGALGLKTGQGFYEWPAERAESWERELREALAVQLRDRPSRT